jgi:hypothetical protein
MTPNMTSALARVYELINAGWDFSEACWKASCEFHVNQKKLEMNYDESCLTSQAAR